MRFFRNLLGALGVCAVLTPAIGQAEELRIGTASLGGAFYPVGQAVSNLVNKYGEGDTMVPVVTQGGTENPRLIASGEVDVAIGNANTSFFATKGQPPYAEPIDLVALGPLHPSILHIATLAGSDITSIADLKGARVAVGPAGGGTLNLLRDVLEVHGLAFDDIQPSFLSYADGFSQLSDGSVDASIALSGYPAAAVMQTNTTNDLAFVPISDEMMAAIREKFPYYSSVNVPGDVYGTDEPVRMVGTSNILIAPKAMDEDRAYRITKAIYGHMDEFGAENANARQIVLEDVETLPVPLHPGAKRFFDEN